MHDLTGVQDLIGADLRHTVAALLEMAVLVLLHLVERLVDHLHLKGTLHIRTVTKPEDDLITQIDTLIYLHGLVIEIGKFICPLLQEIMLF